MLFFTRFERDERQQRADQERPRDVSVPAAYRSRSSRRGDGTKSVRYIGHIYFIYLLFVRNHHYFGVHRKPSQYCKNGVCVGQQANILPPTGDRCWC